MQTQNEYKLARILEDEQRVDELLLEARLELSELLSPENLEKYNEQYEFGFEALSSVEDFDYSKVEESCRGGVAMSWNMNSAGEFQGEHYSSLRL